MEKRRIELSNKLIKDLIFLAIENPEIEPLQELRIVLEEKIKTAARRQEYMNTHIIKE